MIKFSDWVKIKEDFGPYIGNCVDTDTYQVWGACSDQNSEKKNKSIRNGNVSHKKISNHKDKFKKK